MPASTSAVSKSGVVYVTGVEEMSERWVGRVWKDGVIESGDLTIKQVEILDITGKIVGNSSNVSALSQGIYFVRIETDKGIITEKFVKE